MKYLIIEENRTISDSIKNALQLREYHSVEQVFSVKSGVLYALNKDYDLILLEIAISDFEGLNCIKKIRRKKSTPIIVVTNVKDLKYKVDALNCGADDYILKPFEMPELLARINSLIRRAYGSFDHLKYSCANFEIDFETKNITVNNEILDINGKSYDILEYLILNKNIIVSKEDIFNRIWGFDSDTISSTIDVYISKIRKILKTYGLENKIKTIKNSGYMWNEKN